MLRFKTYLSEAITNPTEEIQRAIVLAEQIDGKVSGINAETSTKSDNKNRITLTQVVDDKDRIKYAALARESIQEMDGFELVEINTARSEKDFHFRHKDLSRSVYVAMKPSGAKGQVRDDPNELLSATFAMMDFEIPTTIQELDILIDKAKVLAPKKNNDWSQKQIDLFDKAYTNACQAMSAGIAIKEMIGGKADEGWMTGIKWGTAIQDFKVEAYGMKDFNSSDIILKKGNDWYGVSLKKKETSKAQDPTILNKAFDTLLKGDEFKTIREDVQDATAKFYVKTIKQAIKDGVMQGNTRRVNTRNWKTFMKKLDNEYVNASLKSDDSLFKKIAGIVKGEAERIATMLVNLVLKKDLKDLKKKNFNFSLITGIGKYSPKTGVSIEDADVKDIDTVVAKLDELFAKGKPTIEFNYNKKQAFQEGAGGAKLHYVVKVGGMDIMKNEIRYKGSFTAQPQFFAVFTEKFKALLKPTKK